MGRKEGGDRSREMRVDGGGSGAATAKDDIFVGGGEGETSGGGESSKWHVGTWIWIEI